MRTCMPTCRAWAAPEQVALPRPAAGQRPGANESDSGPATSRCAPYSDPGQLTGARAPGPRPRVGHYEQVEVCPATVTVNSATGPARGGGRGPAGCCGPGRGLDLPGRAPWLPGTKY